MKLREVVRLQLKELNRQRLLWYLGLAAFAFVLEKAPEWFSFSAETESAGGGPGRVFDKLYEWQATLGPRKPRSHFVRLIVLRESTEPDKLVEPSDRCPQREFLSLLLPRIADVAPALIVIDKTFSPDLDCSQTPDLLNSVAQVAKRVPLLVAETTESALQAGRAGRAEEIQKILERNHAVVRMKEGIFPPPVAYASPTLDVDVRKIPLRWPVYPDVASMKSGKTVVCADERAPHPAPCLEPALGFMAAAAYDPTVTTLPAIASLENHRQFAFTNFLREEDIGSYSAIDLLCNAPGSKDKDWMHCNSDPPHNATMQKLHGRVVVIGEQASTDMWDSPIGVVPGVVLQANYIEALLDDRYLQPAPAWMQILFGFFVVAALDIVIEIFDVPETMREHWSRAKSALIRLPLFAAGMLVALVLLAIVGFVVVDIAVVQFGYLPLIVAPGVLGIMLKLGERIHSVSEG